MSRNEVVESKLARFCRDRLFAGFAGERQNPAQTITGTISGSVVDSSGASVPAAKTVLLDEGTGSTRTSETNEAGIFTFDAVRPGTYTVKVEKQGFRAFERTHMVLAASERLPVGAIELRLGQTSETVTVWAQASMVKTDSAEHSGCYPPRKSTCR